MTGKGLDFKHKEVVNINNGKRLGYVQDVCADLNTGAITSIIVPGESKLASMFSNKNDIAIPWVEETLQTLVDIVRQGKALYIGISKYPKDKAELAYK